jgi:hypothetical protein
LHHNDIPLDPDQDPDQDPDLNQDLDQDLDLNQDQDLDLDLDLDQDPDQDPDPDLAPAPGQDPDPDLVQDLYLDQVLKMKLDLVRIDPIISALSASCAATRKHQRLTQCLRGSNMLPAQLRIDSLSL